MPINPEEGFPQSFLLNFNQQSYRILLYVNVLEQDSETTENYIYNLPEPGAFMVMQVSRETTSPSQVIFHRMLVPGLEYEAAELALVFWKMQVARLNLNGVGAFGSDIIGGVASRWV